MRPMWKQTAGFSLLELLLVVLIMAVAAGLAMPMVGQWLGRGDPEQTAWRLRSALSLMRVYAVQRAQAQVFVVDPNSNAYRHDGKVVEVASRDGVLSASGRWRGEDDEIEFHFYPDGTNSGGEIRIEQARDERGAGSRPVFVVALDPLLGTVSVRHEREED